MMPPTQPAFGPASQPGSQPRSQPRSQQQQGPGTSPVLQQGHELSKTRMMTAGVHSSAPPATGYGNHNAENSASAADFSLPESDNSDSDDEENSENKKCSATKLAVIGGVSLLAVGGLVTLIVCLTKSGDKQCKIPERKDVKGWELLESVIKADKEVNDVLQYGKKATEESINKKKDKDILKFAKATKDSQVLEKFRCEKDGDELKAVFKPVTVETDLQKAEKKLTALKDAVTKKEKEIDALKEKKADRAQIKKEKAELQKLGKKVEAAEKKVNELKPKLSDHDETEEEEDTEGQTDDKGDQTPIEQDESDQKSKEDDKIPEPLKCEVPSHKESNEQGWRLNNAAVKAKKIKYGAVTTTEIFEHLVESRNKKDGKKFTVTCESAKETQKFEKFVVEEESALKPEDGDQNQQSVQESSKGPEKEGSGKGPKGSEMSRKGPDEDSKVQEGSEKDESNQEGSEKDESNQDGSNRDGSDKGEDNQESSESGETPFEEGQVEKMLEGLKLDSLNIPGAEFSEEVRKQWNTGNLDYFIKKSAPFPRKWAQVKKALKQVLKEKKQIQKQQKQEQEKALIKKSEEYVQNSFNVEKIEKIEKLEEQQDAWEAEVHQVLSEKQLTIGELAEEIGHFGPNKKDARWNQLKAALIQLRRDAKGTQRAQEKQAKNALEADLEKTREKYVKTTFGVENNQIQQLDTAAWEAKVEEVLKKKNLTIEQLAEHMQNGVGTLPHTPPKWSFLKEAVREIQGKKDAAALKKQKETETSNPFGLLD